MGFFAPLNPPLPGRARAIVVDQTNPDRLWVGVEVGGMLRSDDAGATWQLNRPGENPDIHMLSAHPTNPRRLFVSTGYGRLDGVAEMVEGNAGVFRSDDAGASWQYAWHGITPRYSRPMCIDPRPPYGLTVASAPTAFSSVREAGGAQAMLFRSDDGGARIDARSVGAGRGHRGHRQRRGVAGQRAGRMAKVCRRPAIRAVAVRRSSLVRQLVILVATGAPRQRGSCVRARARPG